MSESVLTDPKEKADVHSYDTNQTMSAIQEAEEAAKKRSSPVLTDSENTFPNDNQKPTSSKSVLNAIENSESQVESTLSVLNNIENAAADWCEKTSPEWSAPEVLKLLTTMNENINSLKGAVQQNAAKLEQIQDLVTQEIDVSRNWRPQISNEVSQLKSVLQVEQLKQVPILHKSKPFSFSHHNYISGESMKMKPM